MGLREPCPLEAGQILGQLKLRTYITVYNKKVKLFSFSGNIKVNHSVFCIHYPPTNMNQSITARKFLNLFSCFKVGGEL